MIFVIWYNLENVIINKLGKRIGYKMVSNEKNKNITNKLFKKK